MMRTMLLAKLHLATVTRARHDYHGSLTVDREILEAVGLVENEQILVANHTNGARFTTYLFEGEPGSGVICVNGAAARLAAPGDRIIVMAFAQFTEEEMADHLPKVAILDEKNHIVEIL